MHSSLVDFIGEFFGVRNVYATFCPSFQTLYQSLNIGSGHLLCEQILEFGFVRLSSPSTPKGQGVVPERVTRFLIQEVDHQLSYRIFIKAPRSLETQDNAGQGEEIAIAHND